MYSLGGYDLLVLKSAVKQGPDGTYYMDEFPLPWRGAVIHVAHTNERYVVVDISTSGTLVWLKKVENDE